MKFLINYLDFKETLKAIFYSIKMLYDIAIEYLSKEKKKIVLAITSNLSKDSNDINNIEYNTLKVGPKISLIFVIHKLYNIPKFIILFSIKGILRLVRDIKHYYINFFLKNRSTYNLYPEYKNLNISKSIQYAILNNTNYSSLSSLKLLIRFFQNWVIPGVLGFILLTMFFILRDIPVNKFLFTGISVGFFVYLLLSGFVFFFKKYKFSKYTTAMHRY